MSDEHSKSDQELWDDLEGTNGFERAMILMHLQSHKAHAGQFDKCLAITLEAADLFLASGRQREYADALMRIGHCHASLGNNEDALTHLMKARDIAELHSEGDEIAMVEDFLAQSLIENGQYEQAITHFDAAERLWEAESNSEGAAASACARSSLHLQRGQYSLALAALDRANDYLCGSHDMYRFVDIERRISTVHLRNDNPDAAVFHARKAISLAKNCACPNCLPQAKLSMGIALSRTHARDEAREYLNTARKAFHEANKPAWEARAKAILGRMLIEEGSSSAWEIIDECHTVFEKLGWGLALGCMLELLAKNAINSADYFLAEEYLDAAIALVHQEGDIAYANEFILTLTKVELMKSQPSDALKCLERLDTSEEFSQKKRLEILEVRVRSLIGLSRLGEAGKLLRAELSTLPLGCLPELEAPLRELMAETLTPVDTNAAMRENMKAIRLYLAIGNTEYAGILAARDFDPKKSTSNRLQEFEDNPLAFEDDDDSSLNNPINDEVQEAKLLLDSKDDFGLRSKDDDEGVA